MIVSGSLGPIALTACEDDLAGLLVEAALDAGVLAIDVSAAWYAPGVDVSVTLGGAVVHAERFDDQDAADAWVEGEGLELALEAYLHFTDADELARAA
jgi:hypothetical protein